MRSLPTKSRRNTTKLSQDEGVHAASVHRWIRRGVLGPNGDRIRLRASRIGGRWFVEDEDWAAFCASLNADPRASQSNVQTPAARSRAALVAEAELSRLGI